MLIFFIILIFNLCSRIEDISIDVLKSENMPYHFKRFPFNSVAKKDSFRFLTQTNIQCEWLWKFYFIYIMGGYCGSLIMASAGSILCCLIFVGQIEKDYLFMPYRLM